MESRCTSVLRYENSMECDNQSFEDAMHADIFADMVDSFVIIRFPRSSQVEQLNNSIYPQAAFDIEVESE